MSRVSEATGRVAQTMHARAVNAGIAALGTDRQELIETSAELVRSLRRMLAAHDIPIEVVWEAASFKQLEQQ